MPSPGKRLRWLFLALLALPALFILLLLYTGSRSTVSDLFSTTAHPSDLPSEIFGLLHFVTAPDEAHRVITAPGDPAPPKHDSDAQQLGSAPVAPEKPITLAWYALGSIANADSHGRGRAGRGRSSSSATAGSGWDERLRVLRERHPLVVFSKSYCPYSRRAKKLLTMYDLTPPPKIIEVDLRADAPHMKTILTRLTNHSTFPNVILNGRSLGGSDDLIRLHEVDELRHVLQESGLNVGWSGEGAEGVVV